MTRRDWWIAMASIMAGSFFGTIFARLLLDLVCR
jgi:hypothetical protein